MPMGERRRAWVQWLQVPVQFAGDYVLNSRWRPHQQGAKIVDAGGRAGAAVPFHSCADCARRCRAPRLQNITGASFERGEAIPQRGQNLGEQPAAVHRPTKFAFNRCRALRDLRRYAGPVIVQQAGQVNIGDQQVNVATAFHQVDG